MLIPTESVSYWCEQCKNRTSGVLGPNGQECFVCHQPVVRLDYCAVCQIKTATNPCVKCGGEVKVSSQINKR